MSVYACDPLGCFWLISLVALGPFWDHPGLVGEVFGCVPETCSCGLGGDLLGVWLCLRARSLGDREGKRRGGEEGRGR